MNLKKTSAMNKKKIFSASEIGEFNYCSISWYLHKCGYKAKSQKIKNGINKHIETGKIINKIQVNIKCIKIMTFVGYFLLFFGFLIFILGVFL